MRLFMGSTAALSFAALASFSGSGIANGAGESVAAGHALKPGKVIKMPGGAGKFDWMMVDARTDCLLAGHKGVGTLDVLDLKNDKLKASLKVGECQGVAASDKYYFAGDAEEQKVVLIDAASLKTVGEIKVPGEIDAIAYDAKNDKLYADHDDGKDVWVIDVPSRKVMKTIDIGGVPEYLEVDGSGMLVFQNNKTGNTIDVINTKEHKIDARWSTAPAEKPHGLALDEKQKRIYTAGDNGFVVSIDLDTGKPVSSVSIPLGADQIAFDSELKRLYCACRQKDVITVVDCSGPSLRVLQNLPVAAGTHTLTVDPRRHTVWYSYANNTGSFLGRCDQAE
jgi:DNA-binding beta-propeller fold protein YncE